MALSTKEALRWETLRTKRIVDGGSGTEAKMRTSGQYSFGELLRELTESDWDCEGIEGVSPTLLELFESLCTFTMDDDERQRLVPYIPRLLDTQSEAYPDTQERQRVVALSSWLWNVALPEALDCSKVVPGVGDMIRKIPMPRTPQDCEGPSLLLRDVHARLTTWMARGWPLINNEAAQAYFRTGVNAVNYACSQRGNLNWVKYNLTKQITHLIELSLQARLYEELWSVKVEDYEAVAEEVLAPSVGRIRESLFALLETEGIGLSPAVE